MKNCIKCNAEIEDDVKFCPKCGATQDPQRELQEKKEETPAVRRCKGCGEEISSDLIFCPKCGVRQNSTTDRKENIDKMIANAASVTDDVSSVVSDAYSLVKFGKKVGKSATKVAGQSLVNAQEKTNQKREEENERIEFIKGFTFSNDPLEIQEQLTQMFEVQKQLSTFSGTYKKMAQRKMEAAIVVLKKNKCKKEAKEWEKMIETPSQKLGRTIKTIILIVIILLVLYGIIQTISTVGTIGKFAGSVNNQSQSSSENTDDNTNKELDEDELVNEIIKSAINDLL